MKNQKILIVDDEGLTALNVKALLKKWGYKESKVALSSNAALKYMTKYDFDLVLMDINLKENTDGIEVANKLKKDFDIPLVYLTAHSDDNTLNRAKLTNPYGYIVKPFTNQELKITIETALNRHRLEIELKESKKNLEEKVKRRTEELQRANESLKKEIKERKKIEKDLKQEGALKSKILNELKDEKNRFILLAKNAPFGMALIRKDGTYEYINPMFEEIFGYKLDEIPNGKEWFKKAYPDPKSRHEAIEMWINDFKDCKPHENRPRTFKVMCNDGKEKIINFTPVLLENNDYLMSVENITQQKESEEEKNANLKRLDILNNVILTANNSPDLESLLENILDIVIGAMNFDGGGIYLIDKEKVKLEYHRGLPLEFINSALKISIIEKPYSEICIEGNSLFIEDYSIFNPENPEFFGFRSIVAVPIYSKERIIGSFSLVSKKECRFTDKEKELINSIGHEIGNTISKLITEEEMKNLIGELKRSNEELKQFAYVTSHDLQEPLRTIASFTQLLEKRYKNKLDDDADEFMEYIVEASIRMKEMIKDLLEYSRITRAEEEFKLLNSKEVVNHVLISLNLIIKENNANIVVDSLPNVLADESQFARVFQNLIENAIKFKKKEKPLKIHISCKNDNENDRYIFSVSDNGIGIENQYYGRIFTIFQRLHTREEYSGNGIGLSISKKIIERHDGHIWVESTFGKGSTFYFTLPMDHKNMGKYQKDSTQKTAI